MYMVSTYGERSAMERDKHWTQNRPSFSIKTQVQLDVPGFTEMNYSSVTWSGYPHTLQQNDWERNLVVPGQEIPLHTRLIIVCPWSHVWWSGTVQWKAFVTDVFVNSWFSVHKRWEHDDILLNTTGIKAMDQIFNCKSPLDQLLLNWTNMTSPLPFRTTAQSRSIAALLRIPISILSLFSKVSQ